MSKISSKEEVFQYVGAAFRQGGFFRTFLCCFTFLYCTGTIYAIRRTSGLPPVVPAAISRESERASSVIVFDSLGKGFLEEGIPFYRAELSSLICSGKNDRPDREGVLFRCSLRGNTVLREEGEWHSVGDKKEGFRYALFSARDGPECRVVDGEGKIIDRFLIEGPSNNSVCEESSLRNAVWADEDLFFTGDDKENRKRNKGEKRLIFPGYVRHVRPNDCLVLEGAYWQPFLKKENTLPILRIERTDEQMMYVTLWSEKGFEKKSILIPKKGREVPRPETIPVWKWGGKGKDCWILKNGSHHFSIAVGDKFLYRNHQWQPLRTPQEIREYGEGMISGELFLVKELVQKKHERSVKGLLFDTLRTNFIPFEVSVVTCER